MEPQDFLALIEQRLGALEARLDLIADRQLTAEVKRTIAIARVDLPFALAKARYVLELIVRDIYRREHPDAKPKPLFNMIEDLCAQKGLFSAKIATDINYIRINGNLIVHAQDEPVAITDRQVEVIVLMTINLVEWYLTDYLPGRPGAREEAIPELPPPPNPYRGLLAFREEDAANYFGREADVADVLAAVARQPLVAVVGPSGSGKSSLVQAGVVAQLGTTDGWVVATFRPRGRPCAELAQALVARWPADPVERLAQAARLADHWAAAEIPLIDAVHETLRQAGGHRLLLIADQFEEVYTLAVNPDQAQGFLDLLVRGVEAAATATAGGQPPVLCLLLTLRADFLSHALGHQGLAAVMDRYPKKLLGPVAEAERLRAIIVQPARRAGVELEDLLVERILRDLAQLPGDDAPGGGASLPLLEFTLAQLWDQQRERRLTHLGYEGLGGLQRALSRHADTVYAAFTDDDRERVRHVLVQMVRPGEGTADTRQVATRDQVRPENWPLVSRLADERLVVTGHDAARDEDTAELIHEALIQHWPPLREWLRADRAFRLWQNGLRQALAEWERTGRDSGALLAGARLAEAEERLAEYGARLGEGETGYIQASLAHRTAEAAERERQRRDRERLQRRINFGLVVFLIVALGLASVAGWQWRIADKHKNDAQQQALKAEQRAALLSANVARSLASEGAIDQALLLMLDSLRVFDETSLPDAIRIALAETLEKKSQIETRFLFPNMQVFDTGDALLLVNPQTNDIWRLADSLDPKLLVHGTPDDATVEKILRPAKGEEYLVLRSNGDIERINVNSGEKRKIVLPPPQGMPASTEEETEFLADGLIVRKFSDTSNADGAETNTGSEQKRHYQIFDTANGRMLTFDTPMDFSIVGKAPGGAFYGVNDDDVVYEIQIGNTGVVFKKATLNEMDAISIAHGLRDCVAKIPAAARAVAVKELSVDPGVGQVTCTNFTERTLIIHQWMTSGGGDQTETFFQGDGKRIDVRQTFSQAVGSLSGNMISWVGYSQTQDEDEQKTERIAILLNRSAYALARDLDEESSDGDENNWSLLLNYRHPSRVEHARFVGNRLVVVEAEVGRLVAHNLDQKSESLFLNPKSEIIDSREPTETLHHGNCIGYSINLRNRVRVANDLEITFDTQDGDDIIQETTKSGQTNGINHQLSVLSSDKKSILPLGDAIRCVQFSADWKKLAVVLDEGVRVYNFEHILKTGRIPESEIGFIEEPGVISAIFLGTTGEGIVTANLTNQVLLWRQTAKEKNWTSSEIYRSDNPVRYAEPDLAGQRLIVIEDEGEGVVHGLLYSLSAREQWLDLGTDYKPKKSSCLLPWMS